MVFGMPRAHMLGLGVLRVKVVECKPCVLLNIERWGEGGGEINGRDKWEGGVLLGTIRPGLSFTVFWTLNQIPLYGNTRQGAASQPLPERSP